jgi:hypothetical protein
VTLPGTLNIAAHSSASLPVLLLILARIACMAHFAATFIAQCLLAFLVTASSQDAQVHALAARAVSRMGPMHVQLRSADLRGRVRGQADEPRAPGRPCRSEWSRLGQSNRVTADHACLASKGTTLPRLPILLSSADKQYATFAMCTVPKVGCTNFRKLIAALVAAPERLPPDAFTQYFKPHVWRYPSVWHYDVERQCEVAGGHAQGRQAPMHEVGGSLGEAAEDAPHSNSTGASRALHMSTLRNNSEEPWIGACQPGRLPADVPSFVVGRNPYVRVLSGFLDKMVDNPARHDQWTFHNVNQALKAPRTYTWPASVAGFRRFVRLLAMHGLGMQVRRFTLHSHCDDSPVVRDVALHHAASRCITLHHTASHCITLHHAAARCDEQPVVRTCAAMSHPCSQPQRLHR